jgi:cobalt-zinc-cadmium efflux system outer membrane protein
LSEVRRIAGLVSPEQLNIRFDFRPVQSLPDLEGLKNRARDRADLRALRITERKIGAETELARAEGKADLTASARYSRRNSQFDAFGLTASGSLVPLRDRDNILTFGLSIPILSGNRNRGNIDASEARAAGARQRREFLEGVIPQEVENAYRRLETAREAVQLLASVIEQSEANLKVIREAYTLGQLRALDVLNEQRRLVDTRLSYVDAQVEEEQAQIDLERATGGPIR